MDSYYLQLNQKGKYFIVKMDNNREWKIEDKGVFTYLPLVTCKLVKFLFPSELFNFLKIKCNILKFKSEKEIYYSSH